MIPGRRFQRRPLGDVSSTVTDVTGSIQSIENWLSNAATELAHVKNAVNGGAAGAQAGYNAPTTWTPYLIGGGVLLALLLVKKR
jgi:hypothetical protein